MRNLSRVGLLLVLCVVVTQGVAAKKENKSKKKKPFQATCPVLGDQALLDMSVAYKGKKIYFCCPSCPDEFEADPKAFAAKAHFQLLQTAQIVQVACPLTGHDLVRS